MALAFKIYAVLAVVLFTSLQHLASEAAQSRSSFDTIQFLSNGECAMFHNGVKISRVFREYQHATFRTVLKENDHLGFKVTTQGVEARLIFAITFANGTRLLSGTASAAHFRAARSHGHFLYRDQWASPKYDYCHWNETVVKTDTRKMWLGDTGAQYIGVEKAGLNDIVYFRGTFSKDFDDCVPRIVVSTRSLEDKVFLMINGYFRKLEKYNDRNIRMLKTFVYLGDVIGVLVHSKRAKKNGNSTRSSGGTEKQGAYVDIRLATGERFVTGSALSAWRAHRNKNGFSRDISWSHPEREVCTWRAATVVRNGFPGALDTVPNTYAHGHVGYVWAEGSAAGASQSEDGEETVQLKATLGEDSCAAGVRISSTKEVELYIDEKLAGRTRTPREIVSYAKNVTKGTVISVLAKVADNEHAVQKQNSTLVQSAFAVSLRLPSGELVTTASECMWKYKEITSANAELFRKRTWMQRRLFQRCDWRAATRVKTGTVTRPGGWPVRAPAEYIWSKADLQKSSNASYAVFRMTVGGAFCVNECKSAIRLGAWESIVYINGVEIGGIHSGFALGNFKASGLKDGDVVALVAKGRARAMGVIGSVRVDDGRRIALGSEGWLSSTNVNAVGDSNWMRKEYNGIACNGRGIWGRMGHTRGSRLLGRSARAIFGRDAGFVWDGRDRGGENVAGRTLYARYVIGKGVDPCGRGVRLTSGRKQSFYGIGSRANGLHHAFPAETREYCRCTQETLPAFPGTCWEYLGGRQAQGACQSRPCDARFMCAADGSMVCLKKRKEMRVLPVARGVCRNFTRPALMIVPYTSS